MRWMGHVAHAGERKDSNRVLMGKHEGKNQFGGHRLR